MIVFDYTGLSGFSLLFRAIKLPWRFGVVLVPSLLSGSSCILKRNSLQLYFSEVATFSQMREAHGSLLSICRVYIYNNS